MRFEELFLLSLIGNNTYALFIPFEVKELGGLGG